MKASALTWTIIRPTPFLETWTGIIGAHVEDRHQAVVFGQGNQPHRLRAGGGRGRRDRRRHRRASAPQQRTRRDRRPDPHVRRAGEDAVAASATPASIRHIPLGMLRLLAVAAKPFSPAFARQAQAAVVMNTTDMTAAHDSTCAAAPRRRRRAAENGDRRDCQRDYGVSPCATAASILLAIARMSPTFSAAVAGLVSTCELSLVRSCSRAVRVPNQIRLSLASNPSALIKPEDNSVTVALAGVSPGGPGVEVSYVGHRRRTHCRRSRHRLVRVRGCRRAPRQREHEHEGHSGAVHGAQRRAVGSSHGSPTSSAMGEKVPGLPSMKRSDL